MKNKAQQNNTIFLDEVMKDFNESIQRMRKKYEKLGKFLHKFQEPTPL